MDVDLLTHGTLGEAVTPFGHENSDIVPVDVEGDVAFTVTVGHQDGKDQVLDSGLAPCRKKGLE